MSSVVCPAVSFGVSPAGAESVGGGGRTQDKTFELQNIKLYRGDQLYLFSDGYADQFGGPREKKFGYRRFKQLLLSCAHLSMQEQKERIS